MAFFISMPVKVKKRGNEYCVVEPDDTVVKCHPKKSEAVEHAAAINVNTKSSILFYKDHKGVWNWLGIVSNNRMDREEDILTSDAHKKFVQSIDNGTYKETFDKNAPDLWVWHMPVPIGFAETVAYDERGFLIAAGKGHEGEFYDSVFEGLDKAEGKNPGSIGMSHGMPWDFLEIEKSEDLPQFVTGYMSEEFTFLPVEHAANLLTGVGGIMVKSMPLEIEDYKRDWFVDTFGEDTVTKFDQRLSEIGKAADEAGIPKKEIAMTDSTKKKKDEETVADEVDEETVVEDELATDSELEEIEDKQEDDDEDEEEEEKKQEEDEEDEEDEEEEKQYATLSDLEEVVQEVVKGVTAPFAGVITSIEEIREDLSDLRKELDTLRQSEDQRVTEKVKETPAASLSAIIARTIEGHPQAQIDYDKERKLHQAGPDESEETASPSSGLTGISSIDTLITKQRGRKRVVTARTNGQ